MTTLELLEDQMRGRHRTDSPDTSFSGVCNAARRSNAHPMHAAAVLYNRLVYELQNSADG